MRGQIWGLPLTLTVAPTTGQHFPTACDTYTVVTVLWQIYVLLSSSERNLFIDQLQALIFLAII